MIVLRLFGFVLARRHSNAEKFRDRQSMCLILFAYQQSDQQQAELPLLVAANRDEYHSRAAQPARFWPELPQILAGRDLQGGGTWLGVNRNGRFAAVTNFREPGLTTGERSRGELCINFLSGNQSAAAYTAQLSHHADRYGGFNLLLWDGEQLRYYSNQNHSIQDHTGRALEPGIYGMSNGYLDEAWPKVVSGKRALQQALATPTVIAQSLEILADRSQPRDRQLPDTGVSLDLERLLAPRFILSETYGTRVSTVLCLGADKQVEFVEQSFDTDGAHSGRVEFEFSVD
jgi:uncharacterized protein with NRDE domain